MSHWDSEQQVRELNASNGPMIEPLMPTPSLRTAFRMSCCVMFFLTRSLFLAAQWPDDAARNQTLRLLPPAATNQLITMATRKSAWLFYGMEVTTHHVESNKITLAINGSPDSYLGAALAVAIDARGYFLTAAHVVDAPPPFTLIFHDGSTLRSAPVRIVARIPDDQKTLVRPTSLARSTSRFSMSNAFNLPMYLPGRKSSQSHVAIPW